MTGRAWSTKEQKTLIAMAADGATAAQIAAALGGGRTKDGVRGRCSAWKISLNQARADGGRLRLTAAQILRLRLAAKARGVSPTLLARELFDALPLFDRNRDQAIEVELVKAAKAKADRADYPDPPAPAPVSSPVNFLVVLNSPQLLGSA